MKITAFGATFNCTKAQSIGRVKYFTLTSHRLGSWPSVYGYDKDEDLVVCSKATQRFVHAVQYRQRPLTGIAARIWLHGVETQFRKGTKVISWLVSRQAGDRASSGRTSAFSPSDVATSSLFATIPGEVASGPQTAYLVKLRKSQLHTNMGRPKSRPLPWGIAAAVLLGGAALIHPLLSLGLLGMTWLAHFELEREYRREFIGLAQRMEGVASYILWQETLIYVPNVPDGLDTIYAEADESLGFSPGCQTKGVSA